MTKKSSHAVWEKFIKFIADEKLVSKNDRVILAVSGGPDSMCLLHLFDRLRKNFKGIKLQVVYVDHGLRPGREIAEEKNTIQQFCGNAGISFNPVKVSLKRKDANIESSARQARYSALVKIAGKINFNKIATGHNANDNTETILLNLLRSTGQEGLRGIPLARKIDAGITVIRPMLNLTRKEIIGYISANRIKYCLDKTNLADKFRRNFIRHKLMPVFEQLNPSFVPHLNNAARWSWIKERFFDGLTAEKGPKITIKSNKGIRIDISKIFKYNIYLYYKLIKNVLMDYYKKENPSVPAERIINFINSGNIKAVIEGIYLEKQGKYLIIEKNSGRKH